MGGVSRSTLIKRRWTCWHFIKVLAYVANLSLLDSNMTSKQLSKLAKKMGWVLTRHGGKHHIYSHKNSSKQVTIPYSTRDWASVLIKKQLQAVTS